MIRLGINGFGRIGRQVLKAVLTRYPESLQVVAVNDLFDVETNAHLFKYDTNYGRYAGKVGVKKDHFVIDGKPTKSLAFRDPASIPWDDEGVDIVIESTGLFLTGPKASAHSLRADSTRCSKKSFGNPSACRFRISEIESVPISVSRA